MRTPARRRRRCSCNVDAEAIALVQRCERHHLSVPGDLSTVAFDDTVAGLFQSIVDGGRTDGPARQAAALDLLAARLADPGRPRYRVMVSPSLYVRDSSARVESMTQVACLRR